MEEAGMSRPLKFGRGSLPTLTPVSQGCYLSGSNMLELKREALRPSLYPHTTPLGDTHKDVHFSVFCHGEKFRRFRCLVTEEKQTKCGDYTVSNTK